MEKSKVKKLLSEVLSKIDFKDSEDKNKDKQILRAAILAEIDAINLYEQMAEAVSSEKIKKVLLDIAKEEKTHIGEFNALLKEIDAEYTKELEKGTEEVEELSESFKALNKRNEDVLNQLSELDTSTYMKLTSLGDPAWEQFLSNDEDKEDPKRPYNKKFRIDKLARERFEEEFYKEFPKESIEIETSNGTYVFKGISWKGGAFKYSLLFGNNKPVQDTSAHPTTIFIYKTYRETPWIKDNAVKFVSEDGIEKTKELLKYA